MVHPNAQSATIADTHYAKKRREVYGLLKELRELGAESDISIPRIAVIGAQSAGKSSLVEAVTGIHVPRDSGTCTRCPMECTVLTTPSAWTCRISLRLSTYDPQGNAISGQTSTVPFSPQLSLKTDVDIWIRRAQTAILSPHVAADVFKGMSYQQLKDLTTTDPQILKFSRDVVVVDIEDPDGTELSFVDLPGLIQNEDPDIIALVKGLVESYVADECTIILVTIPASDDMENQQAVRLARAADPDGKRTIGVVTKPDWLTAGAIGAREKWQDVIEGRVHQQRLGYFVVKLPDDSERSQNLSRAALDGIAHSFFAANPPWKNLVNTGRLGLPNFISFISKLLMDIIEESIPRLKKEASARLNQVMQAISLLPDEVTADATIEVLSRISGFCRELEGDVYGRNESKGFVHQSQVVYKEFNLAIRRTLPNFRPFEEPQHHRRPSDPCPETEYLFDDIIDREGDFDSEPLGLLDVRRVIKECTAWELPGHIPYEAKTRLIRLSTDKWSEPALLCFNQICAILFEYVDAGINKHFGHFKALELYIGDMVKKEANVHVKDTRQALQHVVERERSFLFTQNDHYFVSTREKWLAHHCSVSGNAWTYDGRLQRVRPVKAVPVNGVAPIRRSFEDELTVMADVRAYVQVAYKRIIDHVMLTSQWDLNQVFVDGLQKRLIAKLNIGSVDTSQQLAKLLEEDPALAAQRVQLAADKRRLEGIVTRLNNFAVV